MKHLRGKAPPLVGGALLTAIALLAPACSDSKDSQSPAACSPGTEGCPCQEGEVCQDGLVCDAMACRPATGCGDTECSDHQLCAPGDPGEDARCLPECEQGFAFDPIERVCVESSVTLTCDDIECAEGETCLSEMGDQDARCVSGCPENTALMTNSQGVESCEICFGGSNPCGREGETGAIWPVTADIGDPNCVCETTQGFYYDAGLGRAQSCDADNDGWVRDSARSALEKPAGTGLRDVAQCALRTVDHFVLENELGQRRRIFSCPDEGLVMAAPDTTEPCEEGVAPATTALYESTLIDDSANIDEGKLPIYAQGDVGRRLQPGELNPLTRTCQSGADANANAIDDINESQGRSTDPFVAFAYFVELHRGWFEEGSPGQPGRYVIQERSRCEQGFALTYTEAIDGDYWRSCMRNRDSAFDINPDALTPIGFDFARWSCEAPSGTCPTPPPPVEAPFDEETRQPGPHGVCEEGVVLEDDVWRGMNHHSQFKCVQIVDEEAIRDVDRSTVPHQILLSEVFAPELGSSVGPRHQFNACRIACPEGDPDCALDCPGGLACDESSEPLLQDPASPQSPIIQCDAVGPGDIGVGTVGFASLRYNTADRVASYRAGCIDEFSPGGPVGSDEVEDTWKGLCLGEGVDDPDAIDGIGNPSNFGKLICTCNPTRGGPSCEMICPQLPGVEGQRPTHTALFGGPPRDNASPNDGCIDGSGYCLNVTDEGALGRFGFWMCGGLQNTRAEPAVLTDGDLNLTGGFSPSDGQELCQNEGCNGGYRLR